MGIQSFVPASGGGMPGASYIASIQMTTYNRSWAQAGGPGKYALVSSKLSNGYAYFIAGGTTTGVPLGNIIDLPNGFTQIDIVAPKDDYIMLYKVAVKTTTEFANPFANFSSFPSQITTSGNFVLPNNALPLVNIMVVGGGGGGGRHGGGGGGGGGIVKLTAYQAVGTTSVTIGSGGRAQHRSGYDGWGAAGGSTYFGNVYALGGGGGAMHGHGANNHPAGTPVVANGGGGGSHNNEAGNRAGGTGTVQTASTGLGTAGAPVYVGGFSGGTAAINTHGQGGGGGGAGGAGGSTSGDHNGVANGGVGHASDIAGVNTHYSVGGSGGVHGTSGSRGPGLKFPTVNWVNTGTGMGGFGGAADGTQGGSDTGDPARGWDGGNGTVIVRYYIP